MRHKRPAVFLDRDGVIIANRSDYVKTPEEALFLPRVFEALRRIGRSQYTIVLITNQSAVGRGIITLDLALHINQSIIARIVAQGGRVDASYMCPHRPEDKCGCRKPAPGMLLRAAEDLELNLTRSYVIGDAVSDIQAAHSVGARGILILTGRGEEQADILKRTGTSTDRQDLVMADLEKAVDYILNNASVHRENLV